MPEQAFRCFRCQKQIYGVEAQHVLSLELPRMPFRRHFLNCPPLPEALREKILTSVVPVEEYRAKGPRPTQSIRCTWG